jgi:5-methyltetrahydropteroyltriglutamate--homocysteine methyltransferase
MSASPGRILTTHVGSLPRSQAVTDVLFARERDEARDVGADDEVLRTAVAEVVRRQVGIGIDVVSDGEMSKISYATYIARRLSGFDGDTPREPGQDLVEFPGLLRKLAERGATAKYRRPRCVAAVAVKDLGPLTSDLRNLQGAVAAAHPTAAFMNAASPGVIALFQPNDYYRTQDEYLEALAAALQAEYEGIVRAGIILQIDAPDLAMGRHTMYRDRSLEEFERLAARHIEVLNHALRNVPAERVRMHVCWGNYEGPHHHDVPLARLLPIVLKARAQGLLFEAANPRHAHEWAVFKDVRVPEDKVLIPGVVATTTNYIEHPELVAERLERFAHIVGRERVMAGTDCGFGTFAGFGPVEPDIAYLKLRALVEGAQLASRRLWG